MRYTFLLILLFTALVTRADTTICVPPVAGDATAAMRAAIEEAAAFGGASPVTICLSPADYHISRRCSTPVACHISNTASEHENPDPTKHVGLLLRGLRDVTVDGCGARLVTHGEMTAFVIDSCARVTLKNFTLEAADPTVPELTVTETDSVSVTFRITEPSRFAVTPGGRLRLTGEGWEIGDDAIAQVFYPDRNVTLRCQSPLTGYLRATQVSEHAVRLEYPRAPHVSAGETYQLRHSIRNEVCGFINRSLDVRLENLDLNFMGNFGIVGQFSENITYDGLRCCPDSLSRRTCAGFADFLQLSGCRGLVRIVNSRFEGSQDDPVNIHGTHLQVLDAERPTRRLTVRYMHPQTFGFPPCQPGDSIEIVDRGTLMACGSARVDAVEPLDLYRYRLTLDAPLPDMADVTDFAVENITWTPEVEIIGNYFGRTPTRGILITTRRRSVIAGNTFHAIPMPSILVSDDARSWYESGPVRDLTICGNRFIGCASPVIEVKPEVSRDAGCVHGHIVITDNIFEGCAVPVTSISGACSVTERDNMVIPGNGEHNQSIR